VQPVPKFALLAGIATSLLLFAVETWGRSRSYEAVFTPFELRRMTNDPATNPELETFAEKIDDPAAEAEKVIKLAAFVAGRCVGSRRNGDVIQNYVAKYISRLNVDQKKEAELKAQHFFIQIDYVEEAELCAGIDYLFGPKGVLLPDAVTPGIGEMNLEPFLRYNLNMSSHYITP
jgi:hypothetical protein